MLGELDELLQFFCLRVGWRGGKTGEGSLTVCQREHELVMWRERRSCDRLVAKVDRVAQSFCFSGFYMAIMHTIMIWGGI